MHNEKKALRRRIADLKKEHKASAVRQSETIMAMVEAHPFFQAADTVLLYHSLPDEVCTHEFVRRWSERKRVLLPVVVGNDLELCRYTGPDSMRIGAYGIEEPVGEPFTAYAEIGFVLVPGVAFDVQGNRLGRGKGYYDRLLPRLTSAFRAGVCFPYQLFPSLPTEAFDIRMHEVLTLHQ